MRVVLDTNVLVSGLLNPHGAPGRVVDLLVLGKLRPQFDDRILHEYRDVLARSRFGFDPDDVEALLEHLRSVGDRLTAPPLAVRLPDEDDLPFLEVAACGGARALVTGNGADFEPRRGSHSVPVLSPDAFLEEVLGV